MEILNCFFIFIFGLIIGSFLNCVIYRLETGDSFVKGRSFCPHCKRQLNWRDLIPVLSFLLLKGKCRYCHKPISWQYPLIELSTGILFVVNFTRFNLVNISTLEFLNLCYLLIVSCFLIIIFVYDLKHYIIPDKIIYPAIVVAFLYQLFRILNFEFNPLLYALLSAIIASGFFLLIVLISRGKWMGVGDIKLAFLMGLILGWPNILTALFLAFFIGAIIGVGLIAGNKKTLKSELPFGPFLVTGTFIALFWGQNIINWYLNFCNV